jgi:hypothetical protein
VRYLMLCSHRIIPLIDTQPNFFACRRKRRYSARRFSPFSLDLYRFEAARPFGDLSYFARAFLFLLLMA